MIRVAKLCTGQLVAIVKEAQHVQFSPYKHVLVATKITSRFGSVDPKWVPETYIAYRIDIEEEPLGIR